MRSLAISRCSTYYGLISGQFLDNAIIPHTEKLTCRMKSFGIFGGRLHLAELGTKQQLWISYMYILLWQGYEAISMKNSDEGKA